MNLKIQLLFLFHQVVFLQLKEQQQPIPEKALSVPLCSDQFKAVKSEVTMHYLDSSEPNVFIEVAWNDVNKQKQANVLDIILTDKVSPL